MANNCLVTKLKGSVDNASLLKMGQMKIHVSPLKSVVESSQRKLTLYAIEGKQISVDTTGVGYFSVYNEADLSDPSKRYTHYEMPSTIGSASFFFEVFPDAEYDIIISNKYNIRWFKYDTISQLNHSVFSFNLCDIAFSTGMTEFNVNNSDVNGNIRELSKLINLEKLNLVNTSGIQGRLSDMGSSVINNIQSIKVSSTKSEKSIVAYLNDINGAINLREFAADPIANAGEITTFVSAQKAAGKTVRTIEDALYVYGISNSLTFNGVNINTQNNAIHITWDNSNRIVVYADVFATPSSAPTVYTKGYSQSEAEAAFSGKTIIRVDA